VSDDDFPVPANEPEPTAKPKAKGRTDRQRETARRNVAKAQEARRRTSVKAAVEQVETSIAEGLGKGGALLAPVLPLPGGYLVMTAPDAAAAVARIAQNNPKLLARLSKASDVMDYVALGYWAAGLGVAVAAQLGRVPVDSMLASQFGIDELAEQMFEGVAGGDETTDEGARASIVEDGAGRTAADVAAG